MSLNSIVRTVVLLSISLVAASIVARADQPPGAASQGSVRNVVLVHGAFVDGSSWDRVIRLLQAKGFHVTAVENPLTSLADDVAATRRVLKQQVGPTVLVGHSWGGTVITEAAADDAAMKPDDTGFLWLDRSPFHDDFAADVSLAETRVLAATQQPIASSAFAAPLTHAAWKNRPSWYIVSDRDRAVSPETEEWMAKRIGAATIHVRASHLSLISQPSAIAQVIEEAARHHDRVTR